MNRITNHVSARLMSRRSGAAYNALLKGTPNPLGVTRGRRAAVIAQNLFNQLSKELHVSANTTYASEQPYPLGKAGKADNSLSFHIASPIVRRDHVLNVVRNQLREHTDPFYVVDLSEVVYKYNEWVSQVPRARPFYAVKCNDDPKICETLANQGAGFDCASKAEMAMILKLGVSPDDIIFAHPAKQVSHLRYAAEHGVRKMTFDNEDELIKIKKHHPNAQLVLRILTDDSHSMCRLGLKFGAPIDIVPRLLQKAKDLEMNVIGISYHVGSGNGDASSFASAVHEARKAFDFAEQLGMKLTLLDIGGGFPGSECGVDLDTAESAYQSMSLMGGHDNPYAKHPSFRTIASHVRAALDECFPPGCGVDIISEPGRFFAKSTHTLAVNVVAKRKTVDEASGRARLNYYVNDGLYGSFNCILYDHAPCYPNTVMNEESEIDLVALAATATLAPPLTTPMVDPIAGGDDAIAMIGEDGMPIASDDVGLIYASQLNPLFGVETVEQETRQRMFVGSSCSSDDAVAASSSYSSATSDMSYDTSSVSASVPTVATPYSGSSTGAISATPVSHSSIPPQPTVNDHADAAAFAVNGQVPLYHTTIWGPTCDSIDKISDGTLFPELQSGDWLVYENMGAYTIAGSCRFNGFPIASKVYIELDGSLHVKRDVDME